MAEMSNLSEQEVQELIRIADHGVKERRGYWYTLGIPIRHRYNLDEQVTAIERLGYSRNPTALEYLLKLAEKQESRTYPKKI